MSSNKDIFNSAVLPVMKKVQHDLEEAKRQEMIKHQSSWHANMLGGIGPDGGMTAIASHNNLIYTIGEWNSKTADDYLKTVNKILLSKGIKVTPEIEQQMIDYLVKQKMPKSTTDYIIKNTAYSRAGVREYWIVDPAKACTTVYDYDKDAAPTIIPFDQSVQCGIFPDLSITVSDYLK